jgi:hypothetical protein
MDFAIERFFELLKFEPGSGMVHSILLLLIWINIRSLKKMLERLEVNHDDRISKVENRSENHEGRLMVLEHKY